MEKYLKELISQLKPFGDVLEVGFTNASKEIQKYRPRSHVIIEPKAEEALAWAKDHPDVKIIEDTWQGALPQLGVFDTVFFGIDPVEAPLFKIRYTDHDLDAFCGKITEKLLLSRFLTELEQNGQITTEQKERMIQKYHLTHESAPRGKRTNEMTQFLQQCLATHMRKGSRFSCYLESEIADPFFFSQIIVDPFLDYRGGGRSIVIEKIA